jgi:DNA-binding NarL/FixJ family response regulator
VDDSSDVRLLLRVHIGLEPGLELVGEGADGVEAIALAAAEEPDVMVLDMMMPKKTGLDALPEILAVSPHTSVILFSSQTGQTPAAALGAGASAYVDKSESAAGVIEAIWRVVKAAHA